MALMLCLSDYEATGFLDEAAGRLATSDLLDQCADHVLDHAGELALPVHLCFLSFEAELNSPVWAITAQTCS